MRRGKYMGQDTYIIINFNHYRANNTNDAYKIIGNIV